jgi:hypothetical protein
MTRMPAFRTALSLLVAAVLAAPALGAKKKQKEDTYRLKGSPYTVTLPKGAKPQRKGAARPVESGSYTLREIYGEEKGLAQIILPLQGGFISLSYYKGHARFRSAKDHLAPSKTQKRWGKKKTEKWDGLSAHTVSFRQKGYGGGEIVYYRFVIDEGDGASLVLELKSSPDDFKKHIRYWADMKKSLRRDGGGKSKKSGKKKRSYKKRRKSYGASSPAN